MNAAIDRVALLVFLAIFALVTVLGFVAARWRRPATLADIDEWGLGGRNFGPWITWFLLGGEFYTAYALIAAPALVYVTGGFGYFSLVYAIILYPIVFAVMPRIWSVAKSHGHVTAADLVYSASRSRALELAIALTGIAATMPYIALQLVGMAVVLKGLGLAGELPIIAAFLVLAIYTYSAGLRAPALIAFVKDILIYVVVIAAVTIIPSRLGGYPAVFTAAADAFRAKAAGGLLVAPTQIPAYATLALGSAAGAFFYPHTITAILASSGRDTIRRNAAFLPAYTIILGFLGLLGYMAHAAHIRVADPNDVVPALFSRVFPGWFLGGAFAAIAIAALVPAAVMSIGAANLFTRNIWKAYVNPSAGVATEARVAKISSLVVKLGALLIIAVLPTQFSLDLQLLGGIWILQTLPAILCGAFGRRVAPAALLIGWLGGMIAGSGVAALSGFRPLHPVFLGGSMWLVYTGFSALLLNLLLTGAVHLSASATRRALRERRAA